MSKRTILYGVAVLVALGLFALLLAPKGGAGLPPSGIVSDSTLTDLVARGATLVDVRTAGEYAAGHISGARNVPVSELTTAATSWDKATPIVVYCQTGSRSNVAAQYLTAQGFQHVYDLAAGIERWNGATTQGGAAGGSGALGRGPVTKTPTMYEFASDT